MKFTVGSETFFHINNSCAQNDHPLMTVGQRIDVGQKLNPFFGFYDRARTYPVTMNGTTVELPAISFLQKVDAGEVQTNDLSTIAVESVRHFQMYVREEQMENVRLRCNPDAPSRQCCMWLLKSLDDVKIWIPILGNTTQIVELKVTGRVHHTDATLLSSDSEPRQQTIERAERYWRGELSEKPQRETLFAGTVEVTRIMDPASFESAA